MKQKKNQIKRLVDGIKDPHLLEDLCNVIQNLIAAESKAKPYSKPEIGGSLVVHESAVPYGLSASGGHEIEDGEYDLWTDQE